MRTIRNRCAESGRRGEGHGEGWVTWVVASRRMHFGATNERRRQIADMSHDNPSSNRPEGRRRTQQAVRSGQGNIAHSPQDTQDNFLIPTTLDLPTINTPEAKLANRTINTLVSISNWRHTDELQYIPSGWEDIDIVQFLVANTVSIPSSTPEPLFQVVSSHKAKILLPCAYRLPLLWVMKLLWRLLEMILTAPEEKREKEWTIAKFELLHMARLCERLLNEAATRTGMDNTWRCPPFDRALHRYYMNWVIQRDEFVRDFWLKFGENEYEEDVLNLGWHRWVLREHAGVSLTQEDVANGITAAEFSEGLIVDNKKGSFEWREVKQRLNACATVTTSAPVPVAASFRGIGEHMWAVPTDVSRRASNEELDDGYTLSLTQPSGHAIANGARQKTEVDELRGSQTAEKLANALVRKKKEHFPVAGILPLASGDRNELARRSDRNSQTTMRDDNSANRHIQAATASGKQRSLQYLCGIGGDCEIGGRNKRETGRGCMMCWQCAYPKRKDVEIFGDTRSTLLICAVFGGPAVATRWGNREDGLRGCLFTTKWLFVLVALVVVRPFDQIITPGQDVGYNGRRERGRGHRRPWRHADPCVGRGSGVAERSGCVAIVLDAKSAVYIGEASEAVAGKEVAGFIDASPGV
ncbi:hypothetical protein C8R43DRAFT_964299 [Mycena crocata]|nr:hypothetical protein C8R43DRAFT_964299 [Mycena crocata]